MSHFFFLLSSLVLNAQTRKVVALDGSGQFTSVQAAINSIPHSNSKWIIIYIKKGTYKERVTIDSTKSFIRFIGEDVSETRITFDNYSSKKDNSGKDFGTSGSSSIFINGDNITFENITFENSSGPVGQAVAVNVMGHKVAFKNCRFLGFQDTLYTKGTTWQYYKNCYIEGTVDYIFGSATAVFENCVLHNKLKGGPVTAASTPEESKFGYVFIKCKLTSEGQVASSVLGRPWRPYAKTVFIKCDMGKHIKPVGWDNWGKPQNEITTYYAEYKTRGEGSNAGKRLAWSHQLTDQQAKTYNLRNIFPGWKPFRS